MSTSSYANCVLIAAPNILDERIFIFQIIFTFSSSFLKISTSLNDDNNLCTSAQPRNFSKVRFDKIASVNSIAQLTISTILNNHLEIFTYERNKFLGIL